MTALASAGTVVPERESAGTAEVEQRLWDELAAGGTADVWVYLREQADLSAASSMADRGDQGWLVYEELTETAELAQADLRTVLDEQGAEYESFWIANTVKLVGADAELVEQIAARPDVAQITADRVYKIPEPEPAEDEPRVQAVEWNIDRIGAPQVWSEFGVTGEGIVVGSIDSGAQFDHPALVNQYLGNQGDGMFDHNYNWWDPSNICGSPSLAPCDNDGHGTHVTGTMVGDDGDNQIGVAPGARWIAAKGCETSNCSQTALLSAGQFILAPTDMQGENPDPERRPHIVNNSWGGPADADPWYRPTVQAWVAAGIFPQFANGNTLTGVAPCGSSSNPGNLPESYAAGAFDINDTIAVFSNRGPSAWDDELVKPNISAPGVSVRSSLPDNGYGASSGTSMASPHVAGAVALMWSAAPSLVRDIAATRQILDSTAIDTEDLTCGGTPDNNNVWGQGHLDAFAAVDLSPQGPTGTLRGAVADAANGQPVGGATVSVVINDHNWTTTADGDGRYTVGPLPVGTWEVRARAESHRLDSKSATIMADESTTLDFALAPLPQVTGVVSAAGDGEPIAGVTVTAVGAGQTATTRTGEDGAYRLFIDIGTWTVAFERVSYAPETRNVEAAEDGERIALDVELGPLESWSARYNGPGDAIDVAEAVHTSPDGDRLFVTGRSGGDGTGSDYATVAYDAASGDELWVARYDGPGGANDSATALDVSPDGSRVFVTGSSPSGSALSTRDYATVAYDAASGDELWVARYDGPGIGQDAANALAVSPDGSRLLVTGSSTGVGAGSDYATVAYDTATGGQLWVARYDGPGGSADLATGLDVSLDGSHVVVTGRSVGDGTSYDYATLAYDPASGEELWVARYNGPVGGLDLAWDMGISLDGSRVFVTGYSAGDGTGNDYATAAYDAASGDEMWVKRYDGPGGDDDVANALGVSPDGSRVFVTGTSPSGSQDETRDYATVAYNASSGAELWATRYDRPGNAADLAWDLGVSPDGSAVFVTGESWTDAVHLGTARYATVAYDALDGREQWVAEYSGPDDDPDIANALSVSPDASQVFVTGQSKPVATGSDYATIAYDTGVQIALAGTVTDANDELPLGGATVIATRDDSTYSVVTDINGNYAMSLPAGHWTVEFAADRYVTDNREVVIDEIASPPVVADAALRTGIASLDPDAFDLVLSAGQQQTFDVHLANQGSADLTWDPGDDTPPWVAVSPPSGQIEPGGSDDLALTVDATGLEPGTYSIEVLLVTNAGRVPEVVLPVQLEVIFEPSFEQGVNAGGPAHTEVGGNRWAADRRFQGSLGHEFQSERLKTRSPIDGTMDALYQQARVGDAFAYRFDGLDDGRYEVELHFAEIEPLDEGERRFDVIADGVTLLAGYDVAADVGLLAPAVHRFTIEVTDGGVRIWFLSRRDSAPALVSAIRLTHQGDLPASWSRSPGTALANVAM